MTKKNRDYIDGAHAAEAYYSSQGFASYTRFVRAEDAIKLFLPPVNEAMIQTSTPMPKPRRDWMKGFTDRQKELLR